MSDWPPLGAAFCEAGGYLRDMVLRVAMSRCANAGAERAPARVCRGDIPQLGAPWRRAREARRGVLAALRGPARPDSPGGSKIRIVEPASGRTGRT